MFEILNKWFSTSPAAAPPAPDTPIQDTLEDTPIQDTPIQDTPIQDTIQDTPAPIPPTAAAATEPRLPIETIVSNLEKKIETMMNNIAILHLKVGDRVSRNNKVATITNIRKVGTYDIYYIGDNTTEYNVSKSKIRAIESPVFAAAADDKENIPLSPRPNEARIPMTSPFRLDDVNFTPLSPSWQIETTPPPETQPATYQKNDEIMYKKLYWGKIIDISTDKAMAATPYQITYDEPIDVNGKCIGKKKTTVYAAATDINHIYNIINPNKNQLFKVSDRVKTLHGNNIYNEGVICKSYQENSFDIRYTDGVVATYVQDQFIRHVFPTPESTPAPAPMKVGDCVYYKNDSVRIARILENNEYDVYDNHSNTHYNVPKSELIVAFQTYYWRGGLLPKKGAIRHGVISQTYSIYGIHRTDANDQMYHYSRPFNYPVRVLASDYGPWNIPSSKEVVGEDGVPILELRAAPKPT